MIFGYLKFLVLPICMTLFSAYQILGQLWTYGEKPTAPAYGITVNSCENNYSLSLDLLSRSLLSPESWAQTINQEEFTLEMKPLSISEDRFVTFCSQ